MGVLSPSAVAATLDCVRTLYAVASGAAPTAELDDAFRRAASEIEESVTEAAAVVGQLQDPEKQFARSSPLGAEPEVLALVIPPDNVYHHLAPFLPGGDAEPFGLVSQLLECNILQAMEHRLRLIHERITWDRMNGALQQLSLATLVIERDGAITSAGGHAEELFGFKPRHANDFLAVIPQIRTWVSNLGEPSDSAAVWEAPERVSLLSGEMYMFGLHVDQPRALHLFFDRPGGSHAVRAAARTMQLTPREEEILDRVCAGLSNVRIAEELRLSQETVKLHVSRLLRKFGLRRRVDLVRRVYEMPRHLAPLSPLAKVG